MFPVLHMKVAKRLHDRRRICASVCLPDLAAAKIRSDKQIQRKEAKIMETKYKIDIHILEACEPLGNKLPSIPKDV